MKKLSQNMDTFSTKAIDTAKSNIQNLRAYYGNQPPDNENGNEPNAPNEPQGSQEPKANDDDIKYLQLDEDEDIDEYFEDPAKLALSKKARPSVEYKDKTQLSPKKNIPIIKSIKKYAKQLQAIEIKFHQLATNDFKSYKFTLFCQKLVEKEVDYKSFQTVQASADETVGRFAERQIESILLDVQKTFSNWEKIEMTDKKVPEKLASFAPFMSINHFKQPMETIIEISKDIYDATKYKKELVNWFIYNGLCSVTVGYPNDNITEAWGTYAQLEAIQFYEICLLYSINTTTSDTRLYDVGLEYFTKTYTTTDPIELSNVVVKTFLTQFCTRIIRNSFQNHHKIDSVVDFTSLYWYFKHNGNGVGIVYNTPRGLFEHLMERIQHLSDQLFAFKVFRKPDSKKKGLWW